MKLLLSRVIIPFGRCLALLALLSTSLIAPAQPAEGDEMGQTLNRANQDFGFRLMNTLRTAEKDKNVFISPASVSMALAMTYNGAAGRTGQVMAETLGVQGLSLDEINNTYAMMLNDLNSTGSLVTLNIANSLWAGVGEEFLNPFLHRTFKNYQADMRQLDLHDPQTVKMINDWVAEKTNQKIPWILDRVAPGAILYLINAIYFKGSWQNPFDPSQTHEDDFLAPGGNVLAAFMSRDGRFKYFEDDQLQLIILPYKGGKLSMTVILPKGTTSLDDFAATLNAERWTNLSSRFNQRKGHLELPRFKMEYAVSLIEPLKQLGMGIAFNPGQADFSNMMEPPTQVYISEALHKAFIEVNEQGTEAAAATAVGVSKTSVEQPLPPFRMIVNRPFFFMIQEDRDALPLFMGLVRNPGK